MASHWLKVLMNTKFLQADLYSCKQSQTGIRSRVKTAWVWRISDTHKCRHMHKHTLSLSLYTHPSESPASLPSLVSVSLGKKKDFKKSLQSVSAQIPPRPSFFFPASTSSVQYSSFQDFISRHEDKCKHPYFPVQSCPLLLSLLTSLQCSSSQLSFPAVCVSTASPSSSSFLPPLFHFCLPAPLPLVSLF